MPNQSHESIPSKFTVSRNMSDNDILTEVLNKLPLALKSKIDVSKSIIQVPYEGSKEIILNSDKRECIAVASISEIRSNETDWSIYVETEN